MYSNQNFKTKKALREAVAAGPVPCHQPGPLQGLAGPFGDTVPDGRHCAEGPHYPEAHRWYATVMVKDGAIVKVTR